MSPESAEWLRFWSAVGSALFVLAAAVYTARKGRQSTDQAANVGLVGELLGRVGTLEQQVGELWKARQDDADRHAAILSERDAAIRQRDDHIDSLEHHIYRQLPPPPPPRTF